MLCENPEAVYRVSANRSKVILTANTERVKPYIPLKLDCNTDFLFSKSW